MFWKFNTPNAFLMDVDIKTEDNRTVSMDILYDYGSCSVPMLLTGQDEVLEEIYAFGEDWTYEPQYGDDDNGNAEADQYMDGTNPCLEDYFYLKYTLLKGATDPSPRWDYIVMNDNTRAPARFINRQRSLETLNTTYLPWFLKTGATPVFMFTYGYWTEWREMDDLVDVPTFTSLTYEGYRQYAELLSSQLPSSQQPRIAPIGFAFLTIWEENYDTWLTLFHYDELHPSPSGTYLEALITHHTLFGVLPLRQNAIYEDMYESLWKKGRARRMQNPVHPRKPMPTKEEAEYLYGIAERICLGGYIPKSFTFYKNKEAAYPNQDDDGFKEGSYQ
jgi:hypothetical protein